MADINIQRKKSAPSPWILIVLLLAALALAAYFFLRPGPADEAAPAPPAGAAQSSVADTTTVQEATVEPDSLPPGDALPVDATPEALAAYAAGSPAAPDYALRGLQQLTATLVSLADRADLRDPAVLEQRDNLTSATSRLSEPNARLRPGFVAAAGLIRAMQQKGYPALETTANELLRQANELSGRHVTAAEQQQNQQFLVKAAAAVQNLNAPPVL